MADVFEGVKFTWVTVGQGQTNGSNDPVTSLELTFDAEHTDMALKRYIPFIAATAAAGAHPQDLLERLRVVARQQLPPPGHVRHARHGPGPQAVHHR
jgi:hypothetical protein